MGLRFRSEFDTIKGELYKIEIHDENTATYGPDLFINGDFKGIDDQTTAVNPYSIGDYVGGGYVFYVNSTTGEVFVVDGTNYPGNYSWGCPAVNITGAGGANVGDGKGNTAAIAAQCNDPSFAAKAATESTRGDYNDWYLPSQGELSEIYNNKAVLEAAIGYPPFSTTYWSSTQSNSLPTSHARSFSMLNGTHGNADKSSQKQIRLVRSFIPFGPFKTYNTAQHKIKKYNQTGTLNEYRALELVTAGNLRGIRFDFPAIQGTYEVELNTFGSSANIYAYGDVQFGIGEFAGLQGNTRFTIDSTATQNIRLYIRANNNSVSGGTTYFKLIRVRQVLMDVEEFDLRGRDGFKLNYSGSDSTYDLIKPSTLNFSINVDNSALEQLARDIASSVPERFSIRVYRSDMPVSHYPYTTTPRDAFYQLYWFGYINKRVMSIKDMPYPFDLNIAAVDGILDLKGKDFKDSVSIGFTGKRSMVSYLSDIIQKIDISNVYDAKFDQALLTRVNWYDDAMTSTTIDPLDETFAYRDQFTTATDDGRVAFSSYYDVLESVCRIFQCRFMLSEGRFTFIQFLNLNENIITPFIYNKLGRDDGDFPQTQVFVQNEIYGEVPATAPTVNTSAARGGFYQRSKSFGNKITNVQIPFKASVNAGNILPSTTQFPYYGSTGAGGFFTGWVDKGPDLFGAWESNDNISFECTIKFEVNVANTSYPNTPSTPDQYNDFNGKIYIPFYLKAKGATEADDRYWKPDTDIDPTVGLSESGSWVDAATVSSAPLDYAIIVKSKNLFVDANQDFSRTTQTVEVSFSTSAADSSDFEGLYLYVDGVVFWKHSTGGGANPWWGIEQTGSPYVGRVDDVGNWQGYRVVKTMQDISLRVFQDGSQYLDFVTESNVGATLNDNQNNPELLVVKDIRWGDGPETIPLKALYAGTQAVASYQTTNWKLNGLGTGKKIHSLVSDEILNNNYLSSEVLQAKLILPNTPNSWYGSNAHWRVYPFVGFDRKYVDSNGIQQEEVYAFTNASFNPNLNEWSFKGKKIGLPPATVSSDIVFLGTGLVTSVASGAAAGAASQTANNTLTRTTQPISPSGGALTSFGCTALPLNLPQGSVVQLQSSGAEGFWEQVVLATDHVNGATTLNVNSWTPVYSYEEDTPIVITSGTLMGSVAAGADTQVQYNDGGEFAGSGSLTFNDTTGTLTATGISTGDVQAVDVNATGTGSFATVVASGGIGSGGQLSGQSLSVGGQVNFSGLTSSTQTNVIGIDTSTGQLYTQQAGGGSNPAAPYGSVQFNDSGNLGGDASFTFNPTGHQGGPILNFTGKLVQIGSSRFGDVNNTSTGQNSIATGTTTTASSKDAFACGEDTVASDRQSFAGGFETHATAPASVSWGAMTVASGERAFVIGEQNQAAGVNSFVGGGFNYANAPNSFAFGENCDSIALAAFAIGLHTEASGTASIAGGQYSEATRPFSLSIGNHSSSTGECATSFGLHTTASGLGSFAGGNNATASGPYSFCFGDFSSATSNNAVSIGYLTHATGTYSAAFGFNNQSIGNKALTIGQQNIARGQNTFVGGFINESSSDHSIVYGNFNNDLPSNIGKCQFLFGKYLNTPRDGAGNAPESQFVVGRHNVYLNTQHHLFAVGNGSGIGAEANALTVDLSGKVGIGTTAMAYQLQLSTNSAAKPSTNTWTIASDVRVKENIQEYTKGLSEIVQLEPKTYDYNGKAGFDSSMKGNIGIIAQDVKDIFPETISTYNAKLNEEDEEETELYNFDSHALTFALINSVKELNAEVQALRKELNELKNK